MAFQAIVNQNPVLGTPGSVSDASALQDPITVFAEVGNAINNQPEDPIAGILPGQLVVIGSEFQQARLPQALAADVDAIIVTGVSAAAPQVLTAIAFDGVVGALRWPLPTLLNVVFDPNTDWDATNMIITGIDETGALVTDTIAIPNDGNATVPSVVRFVQITQVDIPTQAGAGGTFTLGVQGAASASLGKAQIHGIANNDQHREGFPDLNGIATPGLEGIPYANTQDFAAHHTSRVWVRTQDVVTPGAPAFARIVNSAAAGLPSNCGQFRSDADGGNALLVPGARYRFVDGNIAEVEVSFRS